MSPLVNITVPMARWLDNVLGVESLKKSKESKEAWFGTNWVSLPNSRIKELRKQARSEKGFVMWIKTEMLCNCYGIL